MKGNLVVGQSGGPTTAINNSLVGVIEEALEQPEVEGVYGALHGVRGILNEELIDLAQEPPSVIRGLRQTTTAALGSIRYKVTEEDYERLLEVFKAHDIRYFLYIGGNDSMDTANKMSLFGQKMGYELRAIGVPKTIDNDLVETDHCPGYGSAARFTAMAVRDSGWDTRALKHNSPIKIIEIMGRNAGWLAAASVLGKAEEDAPPHLIYLPERPLSNEQLVSDVEHCLERFGHAVLAMSEGVRGEGGGAFGGDMAPEEVDAFGNVMKGGAARSAASILRHELGMKVRMDHPNYLYRSFIACASSVDLQEAYEVGRAAVRAAVSGETGKMVTLVREPGAEYHATTGLVTVDKVANKERKLPAEYINEEGNFVTQAFIDYARPLIGDPLPAYSRLTCVKVPKKVS